MRFEELGRTLRDMGFEASRLHAGVYYHAQKQVMLVAHVDDLCAGGHSE